jgi:pyruvate dehydrogenase E2 component (dihydrolipoamide acetyltransferase)
VTAVADFRMPSLGADMDEGTLVEWCVAPGDEVHRGQVVAVVDTAKAAIEVEVFSDGVVQELLVEPGTTVAVGTPLARLSGGSGPADVAPLPAAGAPAETAPTAAGERPPSRREPHVTPVVRHLAHQTGVDLAAVAGSGTHGEISRDDVVRAAAAAEAAAPPPRVVASPRARRRAAELGVDLATVVGSGADGVVTVADVEQAAAAGTATPAPAPSRPVAAPPPADKRQAMRDAIGALMARSKREIPHYYLRTTVDLTAAQAWLTERNAARGVDQRVVPAALLLKAAALAARRVPQVNGFFVEGAFRPSDHVHLGVAVSLRGGGLVAPAIHDADRLALDDLMAALKDVVSRARSGRLRASQMSDPTLTVTNLGERGVEEVQGVIYPPQVALVGFGAVLDRPWVVDGALGVHPVVVTTLAADHRVTDGHTGGRYLAAVAGLLQDPARLDDEGGAS